MSEYAGYLLKAYDGTILDSYIQADTYSTTPDQRQDSNSYRDGYGELHRTVLPCVCTTIAFSTVPMNLDDKIAFWDAINSGILDSMERKVKLTYWNDETNTYCTDTVYIPDTKFPIVSITSDTINYGSVSFQCIGYGEER